MSDMRHHEHTFESDENCPECGRLRGVFASLDVGAPPTELRRGLRRALESEPAPRAVPSWRPAAGFAAAALLLGMLLAPQFRSQPASGPEPAPSAASTAAVPIDEGVDVQIRKAGNDVLLRWKDGHGDYVVEQSDRPDFRGAAERVRVQGESWSAGLDRSDSQLTFYRVRPASELLR